MGVLQDASVPQAWFSHFYALGAVCNVFCGWSYLSWLAAQPMITAKQVPPPSPPAHLPDARAPHALHLGVFTVLKFSDDNIGPCCMANFRVRFSNKVTRNMRCPM